MQLIQDVIGEDVVGLTGQNLTKDELLVLVGLANGDSPNKIGASLNADALAMRHIEASIKAKLGAKTQPNMIARGFTLGVLIPRALCLLLSVLCATEHTDDSNRNQTRRNSRTTPASRLARNTTSRSSSSPDNYLDVSLTTPYAQPAYSIS
ncbi:hypothetical protein [Pseudomonas lundensis]|uniref:hypothetical protein n=1 Tax=Pseudomonas lundensis TaxID=86185 RepID=UPI000BA23747|nr:hypothetical protein [Pseudomonas lundensis]NLT99808.1 hypothetical protein [Pseudomonas lundensis]OZY31035.1 hypothetical protein CJF36_18890 [Pseudomonas lundensis]QPF15672.1 hypothetical protein IF654_22750 [Pseudomonas lundensis]